jgi:NhaA family Na+:H+ antiporter
MSLFIGLLAFPNSPALQDGVKIGILLSSFIAAVLGSAALLLSPKPGGAAARAF